MSGRPGNGNSSSGEEPDTLSTPLVPLANAKRRPCLVVVLGSEVGRFVVVDRDVVIGSGEETQLRLVDDDLIAPQHARFAIRDSGVQVTALSESQGTFVDGQRIKEKPLKEGTKIHLGRTVLRLSYYDSIEEQAQRAMFEGALRDSTTRSFNLRYFMERLNAEARYALRHKQALAMFYFEADDFARVRKEHSRTDCDEALARLAELVSNVLRTEDVLARCQGAEFAVLACTMNLDQARQLGERLVHTVAEAPLQCTGGKIQLTVSVGVALYDGMSREGTSQLFERAQKACAQAKQNGGNRLQG